MRRRSARCRTWRLLGVCRGGAGRWGEGHCGGRAVPSGRDPLRPARVGGRGYGPIMAASSSGGTTTIVVMGVIGSGKSTVAATLVDRLGWEFAEGDDFHPAANVEKTRAGHPLDD